LDSRTSVKLRIWVPSSTGGRLAPLGPPGPAGRRVREGREWRVPPGPEEPAVRGVADPREQESGAGRPVAAARGPAAVEQVGRQRQPARAGPAREGQEPARVEPRPARAARDLAQVDQGREELPEFREVVGPSARRAPVAAPVVLTRDRAAALPVAAAALETRERTERQYSPSHSLRFSASGDRGGDRSDSQFAAAML